MGRMKTLGHKHGLRKRPANATLLFSLRLRDMF